MTAGTKWLLAALAGGENAVWRLVALATLFVFNWAVHAAETPTFNRTITFKADGKVQEQKYLWKDDSRTFVLQDRGLPCRNLDGDGRFVIWRFDTHETTTARLSVHLFNCFALSASTDGETFQELAREEGRGGSNEGWKTVDLTALLPAESVYVKIEHGAQEKTSGGFGACIFEVKLELDDVRDIAIAQAAPTAAPITIDGVLDEPVWQHAQPLATLSDRFLTRSVARSATFRLCYDAEFWYVSAHCAQPGAKEVVVTSKSHDSATYSEDAFELFFLPPGQEDHYHLAVNLGGFVFDELNGDGAETWDSNAVVAVNLDTAAWTVEMAVPVKAMGVEALAPGQAWRTGLYRDDMGYAQYAAWSSVAGSGWHAEDRFGEVTLVEAPNAPLPAVNIEFPAQNRMGSNPVKLLLQGVDDADRHGLALDVLPMPTQRLPETDQNLEQMNPIFATLPLQDAKDGVLEAAYTLDRFGVAHLVATLRERATGAVVSRAVAGMRLTPRDVTPIKVTLQQPYVAVEAEIPFEVELNLSDEELRGAKVRTVVVDDAEKSVLTLPVSNAAKTLQGVLPVDALTLGEYTVRVEVVDAQGDPVVSQGRPLTKHAPFGSPMEVTIGDDGLCYVNGEARLPLGFMLAPPDKAIREAGYDIALYGGETLEGRNNMDTAAANGVWAMPHICRYLRGNNDFDGIRAVVSLRKTEPALFAWYLADEPEGYGDTPEVLRKAYDIIKAIDPNHPVVVLTNSPGMLPRYEGCADVIIADPYPIPLHPLSLVAEWTDVAVKAAAEHDQAAWLTPQAFGWADIGSSDAPSPTREELSNMLYACFIHGAKGIIWWPYGAPRQNYWPHFRKMGRESRFIEPWLLHGTDVPGMPTGIQRVGDIHWRAWEHESAVLVLLANLSRQSRAVKIPLPEGMRAVSFPFDEDLDALLPPSIGDALSLTLAPVQTVAVLMSPAAESEEKEAMKRVPLRGPLRFRRGR